MMEMTYEGSGCTPYAANAFAWTRSHPVNKNCTRYGGQDGCRSAVVVIRCKIDTLSHH